MDARERPIHDAHPIEGYYKMRRHKDGPWLPVVIWKRAGELVCRVGDGMADVNDTWLYCAGHRVDKAEAMFAFQNGRWATDAPAPLAHNQPPSDDPFENLQREIAGEEERVKAWVAETHEGEAKANLASNWLAELRKLEGRTVDAFDAEKAPALAESKRIDEKWRDLKARAKAVKQMMDDCFQAIGRKERQRLQEIANQKARAEAEAQRKAWEADQIKQMELAAEHNIPFETPAEPDLPPPVAAPVKVAFGGASGSKIAVKKTPPKALVEDWAKAAAHYSGNPKIREQIQKLATADAKNHATIPGVKIIPGEA